jgi:hypothetical protein
MTVYEIRYLDDERATLLIHVTVAEEVPEIGSDPDVVDGLAYARYEIWRGKSLVHEGARRQAG